MFVGGVPAQGRVAQRKLERLYIGLGGQEMEVGGDLDVCLVAVRDDPLAAPIRRRRD